MIVGALSSRGQFGFAGLQHGQGGRNYQGPAEDHVLEAQQGQSEV